MFGQWLSIYTVLLVIAMEFGLVEGPRTNFSVAVLWWIFPSIIPIGIALIVNISILMSNRTIGSGYLLHLVPYITLIIAGIVPTMYWGGLFDLTFSYLVLHFIYAASMDVIEYVPRIALGADQRVG